tara:strand:+ start:506 stop:628 length:123 start_codon:yes stop_codon:yes gene_type:complete
MGVSNHSLSHGKFLRVWQLGRWLKSFDVTEKDILFAYDVM